MDDQTQPVNPTDDQVTTPIEGEETAKSEEVTPVTPSDDADGNTEETAPKADSEEAAN
ncbi:MAG: hypothetical protein WC400_01360 [Patescibacteria group bacterium]|jgi:hypothetical protein